jgi:DNA topoisomerase-1
MQLLVVESPTKATTIQSYLGAGWEVVSSYGHIRDLPRQELAVDTQTFRPHYVLTERGEREIQKIARLAAKASEVYLATDPDREGEAIAWHCMDAICLLMGTKRPVFKRVVFNEITKTTIQQAVCNTRDIDTKLVAAQEARRVLDRLVGYTVSPKLSEEAGQILSAGRVQSIAVKLVVLREREISDHVPILHHNVDLIFDVGPESWRAKWDYSKLLTPPNSTRSEVQVDDVEQYWLDLPFATLVSQLRDVRVASFKEGQSKSSPPAPFISSTLQQAASVQLSMRPKRTMENAQALFASGHITYHRTDNPNISEASFADLQLAWPSLTTQHSLVAQRRAWKAKASAQEAHEGIRPTNWLCKSAGDDIEQQQLYKMIWMRAVSSQMEDAVFDVREAMLQALQTVNGRTIEFFARGKKLRHAGWKALTKGDFTEEPDASAEANNPVPLLSVGQTLQAHDAELVSSTTKPPKRYTQASLVKKLEEEGIGRPATYASILDTILTREYVLEDKKAKTLMPTSTGFLVHDALDSAFDFMQIQFTKEMEEELDLIASGTNRYQPTVAKFYDGLIEQMPALSVQGVAKHECPKCITAGAPGVFLSRRKKKESQKRFWVCSNQHFFDDEGGKPLIPCYSETFACLACGEHKMVKKRGEKNHYWHCDACGENFNDERGKPVATNAQAKPHPSFLCPACGEQNLLPQKSKYGPYWKCLSCAETFKDKDGAPVSKTKSAFDKDSPSEHACPNCHQHLLEGPFPGKYGLCFKCHGCNTFCSAKDGLPVAKQTRSEEEPANAKECAKCGKTMTIRKGARGKFYGCSGYPACKHTEQLADTR